LSGVSGIAKGMLSGSNPYTLSISGFTAGGTVSVSVSKTGFTISGSPKTVTIYCVSENGIIVPGTTLNNKFTWLAGNAASNNTYIVEVNGDESIADIKLYYSGKNNIVIKLRGIGGMQTISLSSKNRMFTVAIGVTLDLDNNITLKGISDNSNSLINIGASGTTGGTLIMNSNSLITGNNSISGYNAERGGGVYVTNSASTFIMNGGSITGNTSSRDGGGVCTTGGTIIMNGGEISNNSSSSYGAGVYVGDGTFTMNGGEIYGNTISSSSGEGGGVFQLRGKFTKTGGSIYGYTSGNSMSNVVKNTSGVVQNNRGHAIYASGYNGNVRRDNDTGPGVVLSFNDPQGTWDGDWD
jgi:hypothetical protein